MHCLVISSLLWGAAVGQQLTHQSTQSSVSNQSTTVKHKTKLNLFGPNVKGTPRVLGINGIQTVKTGHFKLSDFKKFVVNTKAQTTPPPHGVRLTPGQNNTALVLYDTTGQWAWIGNLYSYQITNLLSHFGVSVTREGMQNYQSGQLASFGSAYYLGTTYSSPLPAAFMTDFFTDTNPFVWMGYNLWEVAWLPDFSAWNPSFTNKFGFQFAYLDGTGYPTVSYKTSTLTKQQFDPMQSDTTITNSSVASVLATSSNGTTSAPYITKGGNLWFVADNPLEYVAYNRGDDRMLAFDDILNDTTGVTSTEKNAVIRIEDVSGICDSASLRAIADTLYAQNIPFEVSVIPYYVDPLGAENNGVPNQIQIQNSPTFISDLKYMQSKGAQLIMHGFSHQYSNVPNPYNGVSAADVEFFRVTLSSTGTTVNVGPVPEDSTVWCLSRIIVGNLMFALAGFNLPSGWNSPHYYGTPTDYAVFGQVFAYSMDRGLSFVVDGSGNLQYVIGYSPYVMTDQYGVKRIPETVGYYDPTGTSGQVNGPTDMIGYANQIQCVRGGWAGMYYHWFEGTTALNQLITGVKALGYKFVSPSGSTQ